MSNYKYWMVVCVFTACYNWYIYTVHSRNWYIYSVHSHIFLLVCIIHLNLYLNVHEGHGLYSYVQLTLLVIILILILLCTYIKVYIMYIMQICLYITIIYHILFLINERYCFLLLAWRMSVYHISTVYNGIVFYSWILYGSNMALLINDVHILYYHMYTVRSTFLGHSYFLSLTVWLSNYGFRLHSSFQY